MSFFNVQIRNDETEFQAQLPELYRLYSSMLISKALELKQEVADFSFSEVLGYNSPKGQCYEVFYKKGRYSYISGGFTTAYMECHVDSDGSIAVDDFYIK